MKNNSSAGDGIRGVSLKLVDVPRCGRGPLGRGIWKMRRSGEAKTSSFGIGIPGTTRWTTLSASYPPYAGIPEQQRHHHRWKLHIRTNGTRARSNTVVRTHTIVLFHQAGHAGKSTLTPRMTGAPSSACTRSTGTGRRLAVLAQIVQPTSTKRRTSSHLRFTTHTHP